MVKELQIRVTRNLSLSYIFPTLTGSFHHQDLNFLANMPHKQLRKIKHITTTIINQKPHNTNKGNLNPTFTYLPNISSLTAHKPLS